MNENRQHNPLNENRPSDKIRSIKDEAKDTFEGLKPEAKEIAGKAKEGMEEMTNQFAERGRVIKNVINDQVQQNPWYYIGGVAVGALLLGFILGRRD